MLNRVDLAAALALAASTLIVPGLTAQEEFYPESPEVVSVLGVAEPGEARLRMTPAELEDVGIPEIAYTEEDRVVADLAEVGLRVRRLGGRLEGDLKSALGQLKFSSVRQPDGQVLIDYELPDDLGELSLLVDPVARTAEASYSPGVRLRPSDRFAFRALAVALGKSLRDASPEADLLLRAARMWGDHPLQEVRLRKIVAPAEKSWTNLCGVTSRSLAHDGSGHGLIYETLAVGPNASNCRSRCGAGCNAILGTSAWTVDCGEHDRCEQHHSCCASCQDEFNSASDDYLFASNCRLAGW
jgi:hypothetical protein